MNRLDCQAIFNQLKYIFSDYPRMALLNAELETIYLKYQTLADIGTLSHCAEVSNKYLQLQDGDIVLTNDPYSGGTLLSAPTLILGIGNRSTKSGAPAEFLIAIRLNLRPRVGPFKTIDDEGLRIPPSPLFLKGSINLPIFEALKAHPLLPKNFMEHIQTEAQKLQEMRKQLKLSLGNGTIDWSKPKIKYFLQCTKDSFLKRLDDLGEGESAAEFEVSTNETIKLKINYHDGHFDFDFTGTSNGNSLFLTDSATIGAAIGATLSFLNEDIPLNSGLFSHFTVKAPRGSMVNSSFPRSLFLGHTDGVTLIANAVVQVLSKMNRKKKWAESGPSYCAYELRFQNGEVFSDSLRVGAGASNLGAGLSGVEMWLRVPRAPSIEKWESEFPIQVGSTGFRTLSNGEGKYAGGMGVVRTIRVLEDAELSWAFVTPQMPPAGVMSGKSGLAQEMTVMHESGEKIELSSQGKMPIKKNATITILSAGGGGFGPQVK